MRRELRKWRGLGGNGNKYREGKKKYKELYKKKKKEEKDKMVREVGEAISQEKVWELVNRERRNKRKKINEEIKMEEWKEYFMELLGRGG